jgi:hypothetical protein
VALRWLRGQKRLVVARPPRPFVSIHWPPRSSSYPALATRAATTMSLNHHFFKKKKNVKQISIFCFLEKLLKILPNDFSFFHVQHFFQIWLPSNKFSILPFLKLKTQNTSPNFTKPT